VTDVPKTTDVTDVTDAPDAPLTVDSKLLGAIEVPATALYEFPAGLVGFESYRRFALVPAGRTGVYWLQSIDEPGLAFVLADPFQVADDYHADVPDAELTALGAGGVTLGGAGQEATANLRAPVVFNVTTRRARQVVLPDDRYGVAEVVRF
jgi:flagellar assembly factor FliW